MVDRGPATARQRSVGNLLMVLPLRHRDQTHNHGNGCCSCAGVRPMVSDKERLPALTERAERAERAADDYDTPWKTVLTRAFPAFMAFYFPDAAAAIDWARGYTFLDQELAQVVQDAALGRRLLDRLVRVCTHDGAEQWVFVHVETGKNLKPSRGRNACLT